MIARSRRHLSQREMCVVLRLMRAARIVRQRCSRTLFDRFGLPLRIPEALPNNNDVEPNHGTGGKRDHVVHNFSLCKKDKIAPRIGLPRFGFGCAEIALPF